MSTPTSPATAGDREATLAARVLSLTAPRRSRRLDPADRAGLRSIVARRWQDDAACASADPEAWWPAPHSLPTPQVVRVCAGCPVRRSCLAVALLWDEDGIWAGTSRGQRRRGYRLLRHGVPAAEVVELLLTAATAGRPTPSRRTPASTALPGPTAAGSRRAA